MCPLSDSSTTVTTFCSWCVPSIDTPCRLLCRESAWGTQPLTMTALPSPLAFLTRLMKAASLLRCKRVREEVILVMALEMFVRKNNSIQTTLPHSSLRGSHTLT